MEPTFLLIFTMPAAGSCSAKGCVFVQNALLRVVISLFLCFCLLLNVFSFPVRALDFGSWILHQIGTDIGVSAILEGLGIFRDAASDYFGELVNKVTDALDNAGYVTLGMLNAYYQVDPLGTGSPLFAFPATLINFVRNWVFDNGVVEIVPLLPVSDSFSEQTNDAIVTASKKNYAILIDSISHPPMVCYSDFPFVYYQLSDGSWVVDSPDAPKFYFFSDSVGYVWYESFSYKYVNPGSVTYFGTSDPGVSSSVPVSLAVISPPDRLFTSAYPQWLEHQRELEDGTMETVVQIGLGNTQAETESLTQEQIWAGQGTLQVPGQDQNQGTLLDILHSIVQLPTQIVGSIQTALQSFFQISGEASDYAIQLRDFFPFCIPFDLFDFITVLSAEPEAPVFHWELPVPQLGQTFELEVDLSAWDEIAVLFRNLELLAFIFGLAIMTREKFLRG